VNPLGGRQTGGQIDGETIEFTGRRVSGDGQQPVTVRIEGKSDVSGGPSLVGVRTDGRQWEHRVQLNWEGYVELQGDRVTSLTVTAHGTERLRWGNRRWNISGEPDVAHLMAGHPIDLDCAVRYGLLAKPCSEDEVVERGDTPSPQRPPDGRNPAEMIKQHGLFAIGHPEIARQLKLSDEQRQQFMLIVQDMQRQVQSLQQQAVRSDDQQQFAREVAKLRGQHEQKLLDILTESQRATWNELTGN
jgi:hypothetical protein